MLMGLLNALPTWAMAVFVCVGAVGLTTAAQVVLHRLWPMDSRHALNEVAGFLIAVVGVVFAVLLASIAILVLERHERAERAVETEAGELADLHETATGLPPEVAAQVRRLISDYTATVLEVEWPQMAEGRPPESGWQDRGWEQTAALVRLLSSFEPATENHKIMLAAAVAQVDDLTDARRARIFTTDAGLAALVWWVVVAGATVTVGLALFFGLPDWRGHLLMANMLALSIALVLVLMIAMDRPFVGASGVTAEPFLRVVDRVKAAG